jgi:hypothetical protein
MPPIRAPSGIPELSVEAATVEAAAVEAATVEAATVTGELPAALAFGEAIEEDWPESSSVRVAVLCVELAGEAGLPFSPSIVVRSGMLDF